MIPGQPMLNQPQMSAFKGVALQFGQTFKPNTQIDGSAQQSYAGGQGRGRGTRGGRGRGVDI